MSRMETPVADSQVDARGERKAEEQVLAEGTGGTGGISVWVSRGKFPMCSMPPSRADSH